MRSQYLPVAGMMLMYWRRALLVVAVLSMIGPSVLMTATADPVTIDRFAGNVESATLAFSDTLLNTSLALDIPPGADIISAELTLEGVGGMAAESSILNFTNGVVDTDVWAHWTEGRDLYTPDVDPRNNRWSAATNRDIPNIQKNDGQYWTIDTFDPNAGKPPGARAYQLYRFLPNSVGAEDITVRWEGFSTCGMNQTNPYHCEMWLYNHTDAEWIMVEDYDATNITDEWINYTFDLPSPFVDTDGSIDVLIVGLNSEWAGPMLPAYDEGHLYTDYIEVEVKSAGGLQYPFDVSIFIDEVEVVDLVGELTGSVTVGDAQGLTAGLQSVLDTYPVTPVNVTLDLAFAVGSPTAGRLTVGDLLIEYDPVVNEGPSYEGPDTVTVQEDGGRQAALDLDTVVDDDYNRGDLAFALISVDDSLFPGSIVAEVVAGPGGNRSLYVTPEVDFFGGPINVTMVAIDAFEAEITIIVSVMVEQVGDRPVLASGGTMEAYERAQFSHVFTVTDVDLPDDAFTFSDSSDLFDVDPLTGELNWTPSPSQIGEHRFGVTVTDRFDLSDTQVYTIDVKNSNDAPLIVSDLTISATQDQEVVYTIRAEDLDVPFGDTLTFFAFADDVEIAVDASTGRMTFTPGNTQVPVFEIIIRVQDTIGITDEEVLVVTVENVNDPPVFADHPEQVHDQGDEVRLQLEVTDIDMDITLPQPETLTFTATGPEMLLPDASGLVSFVADQSMVGDHTAVYTVVDRAGVQDVVTIAWTIRDVNDAPVIATELPDSILEDAAFTMVMEATDADGDDLTWSDDTDLFDIVPSTGLVEFTPTQAQVGDLLITITVTDGRDAITTLSWDLTVTNTNDEPVIVTVAPASGETFDEGKAIQLSAQANDDDGDTLTYTWMRGNKLLGTGATLKVDDLSPGEHTITLVVEDGNGGRSTQDLKVEVASAGMFSATTMIALLVVVLVVVVGVVMYMRSRSATVPPCDDAGTTEEEEDEVEKVTYEMAGVLEYETEGIASRSEGTTASIEEPTYSLEDADEFQVGDRPEE